MKKNAQIFDTLIPEEKDVVVDINSCIRKRAAFLSWDM